MDTTLLLRDTPSTVDEQVLHFKKYFYPPSLAAAILFTILFGLSATLHVYQMLRTKTWFMIPFVIGAACTFAPSV